MSKKDDPVYNIKLVEEIEKYPCLYNYKLPDYYRRDVTDLAWESVAKSLKDKAENCKEKWRNLRTVFVRRQKQPPSGSGRKDSKTYYMTEHMQFILPYIKGVRSVDSPGNLPSPPNVVDDEFNETDEVENTEENISESTAESLNMTKASNEQVFTPKFKKKKTNTSDMVDQCFIDYITTKKQNNKKEEDHRKQFLLSMLPEINQMTDIQMRKFKRKMLDVIDDILGETSIEVANHFQPIQPVSNHSQSYSDYPRSVSSYCSDSSSILTSPMFIQNADNFEHTPTVQEYQSMHHGVLNLSNIDQVQQNNPNTCIPLDMQEYLTRK